MYRSSSNYYSESDPMYKTTYSSGIQQLIFNMFLAKKLSTLQGYGCIYIDISMLHMFLFIMTFIKVVFCNVHICIIACMNNVCICLCDIAMYLFCNIPTCAKCYVCTPSHLLLIKAEVKNIYFSEEKKIIPYRTENKLVLLNYMVMLEQCNKRPHNGPRGAYQQSSVYLSSVLLQTPCAVHQKREYAANNK